MGQNSRSRTSVLRAIGSASRAWRNGCWRQAPRRESASRSKVSRALRPRSSWMDSSAFAARASSRSPLCPSSRWTPTNSAGLCRCLTRCGNLWNFSRLGHGTELRLTEPSIAQVHGEGVRRHVIHAPCPSHRPIALLGIAHRKITSLRKEIPQDHTPTTPPDGALDTLGQRIQFKRIEKGLRESQLAHILEVATRLIKDWESDMRTPSKTILSILDNLLGLTESQNLLNSTPE